MGAEDDERALGHLGLLVDEDGAALAELLDDVLVVDDLLADVDGRAVQVECVLDGLNGAIDARAIAARGREEDALRGVSITASGIALKGSDGAGGLSRDRRGRDSATRARGCGSRA